MSGNVGLPSLLALADSGEITETGYIDNPGFALFLENMEKKFPTKFDKHKSQKRGLTSSLFLCMLRS